MKFIKRVLIPFINEHHSYGNYKFWPDQAGAHYENINFVEKIENLEKNLHNLVYKLMASTSSRLNKIRMHGLIEK